jgi:hypothetical protein
MPAVTMTAVIPSATMPTKAKLRVTLNRLRSVAKVSVATVRATQATTAARNTQKIWRLTSLLIQPPWTRRSMACSSVSCMTSCPALSCLRRLTRCRPWRAAGAFFRRTLAKRRTVRKKNARPRKALAG